MRRSAATTVLCVVPALVVGSVLLVACEDGPNQTFSPASGTLFNNGDVDGAVDPVDAGFDSNYAGRTALQICTADVQRSRWATMLNEVIVPPALFGGLDLRGCNGQTAADLDPSKPCEWPGLSIEKAESLPKLGSDGQYHGGNCQGIAAGIGGCREAQSDSCADVVWGDNGEVDFSYDLGTHLIDQMVLTRGYLGTMQWKGVNTNDPGCSGKPWASAPGNEAKYVLELGFPIIKNSANYTIRWETGANEQTDLAELYDGLAKTFYPYQGGNWPGCTPQNCQGSNTCLDLSNDGSGVGIFGVRPVATYMDFYATLPQPAASVPFLMYIDYAKFVPNSTQDMTLAINQQGPYTQSVIPNGNGTTCQQQIGQTWADYHNNCISPYGPTGTGPALNATNYNKLIGGHTHNLEEITFNVVGINQDFALTPDRLNNQALSAKATNLGTYGIVQDSQLPMDDDVSTEWYFDVRAFGAPANELDGQVFADGPGAGSGLVAREYQRLAQADLVRLYNLQHNTNLLPSAPGDCEFQSVTNPLGAAQCYDSKGNPLPSCPQTPTPVDATHLCTGLEGMIIPGGGTYVGHGDLAGRSHWLDTTFGFDGGSWLKPTNHYISFAENVSAATSGAGAIAGYNYFYSGWDYGPLWDMTFQWVKRVMGKGDVANLPPAAADRRFFFKWFGVAMAKYLKAYGDVTAAGNDPTDHTILNPDTVAAEPIDLETMFFDNIYGTFDKFEYIDLSTIAGYGSNPNAADPTKPWLQVPFDYEYGTDVKVANQRYTNWYKRLDREEFALYQALSPVKSDPPGAHANYGVNLTNMFGSPLLAAAFKSYECAAAIWTGGTWVNDPENAYPMSGMDCQGTYPKGPPGWMLDLVDDPSGGTEIMDLNGQQAATELGAGYSAAVQGAYHSFAGGSGNGAVHSMLWQYPAVWGGQTIFSQGHSAIQVCPPGATNCMDPKQATSVTSASIAAAQVVIPSFKDPFHACTQSTPGSVNVAGTCDPTNNTYVDQNLFTLVPWTPSQPGVGFTIPVNGLSDLAVQTAQIDFTGNLETYVVDYVPWTDPLLTGCAYAPPGAPNGGCNNGYTCQSGACVAKDNTIEVRALEAHDFLGEVFVCQDPTTGDVLHVRMYTSVTDILAWLAAHPGDTSNVAQSANTACGMIVRYSPFDNYPDFVTSLVYGVQLSVNPGAGFGRVVDATLFNTVYETITQ